MKIAALVILFHPHEDVIKNIHSFIDEVDKLYIVDNSEKVNVVIQKQLMSRGFNIEYIANQHNLGIATALNQGASAALRDGYDWLLTMDQDSYFYDRFFFESVRNFQNDGKTAVFAPMYIQTVPYTKQDSSWKIAEKAITSGSIVNLNVWKETGGYQDDLFIDEVDIEYCLKIRKKGYQILLFENIFLIHQVGVRFKTRSPFSGKEFERSEHVPFRYYYISRNLLYVSFKYLLHFPGLTVKRLLYFPRMIYGVIVYENKKLSKLHYICKGFLHFIINKRGQLPQQLKNGSQ